MPEQRTYTLGNPIVQPKELPVDLVRILSEGTYTSFAQALKASAALSGAGPDARQASKHQLDSAINNRRVQKLVILVDC